MQKVSIIATQELPQHTQTRKGKRKRKEKDHCLITKV